MQNNNLSMANAINQKSVVTLKNICMIQGDLTDDTSMLD